MNTKKQTEETIDEQIDRCWYSRWVAIDEKDYQCMVLALKELAKTAGGQFYLEGRDEVAKQAQRTLTIFQRNQDIHYTSREEHREMVKKGIIKPPGGTPNG